MSTSKQSWRRAESVPMTLAPLFVIVSLLALLIFPAIMDARSARIHKQFDRIDDARSQLALISMTSSVRSIASRGLAVIDDPDQERVYRVTFDSAGALRRDAMAKFWRTELSLDLRARVLAHEAIAQLAFVEPLHEGLYRGTISRAGYLAALPAQSASFVATQLAVTGALGAMDRQEAALRGSLHRLGRVQTVLTMILATIALGSAVMVVWLARRSWRLRDAMRENAHQRALSRARAELLTHISHDIRAPLAVVATCTAILQEVWPDLQAGKESKLIGKMNVARRQIAHMVEDLLMAARLQAGQGMPLRRQRTDVTALVERVCEQMQTLAGTVELECVAEPVTDAFVDDAEVERLLTNLIRNATTVCAPMGHVVVSLALDRPGRIVLTVEDDGPGIEPDVKEHIFEPFWRAKAGEGSGFGVGLAIVRAIVDAHGGTVSVESEPGEGATFRVELPVDPDATEDRPHLTEEGAIHEPA